MEGRWRGGGVGGGASGERGRRAAGMGGRGGPPLQGMGRGEVAR